MKTHKGKIKDAAEKVLKIKVWINKLWQKSFHKLNINYIFGSFLVQTFFIWIFHLIQILNEVINISKALIILLHVFLDVKTNLNHLKNTFSIGENLQEQNRTNVMF